MGETLHPRPSTSWLIRGARVQARVIHALLMREVITRFGRHNFGALWLFGEPMLFTLGVTALWTAAGLSHGSSLPIVAFAITGYSSVLLWRNTVSRCVLAIQQNLGLLYHRHVRVLDVLIGRMLIEVVGASASFLALVVLFVALESIGPPQDLGLVLLAWLMLIWLGMALGLVMGAVSAFSNLAERLWHPASYLLFPLSGAAFLVEWLPPAGQQVVLLLPMVHGTEMLREGYFGAVTHTHYSLLYMAGCSLVLTFVGLWLVRLAGERVEAD